MPASLKLSEGKDGRRSCFLMFVFDLLNCATFFGGEQTSPIFRIANKLRNVCGLLRKQFFVCSRIVRQNFAKNLFKNAVIHQKKNSVKML